VKIGNLTFIKTIISSDLFNIHTRADIILDILDTCTINHSLFSYSDKISYSAGFCPSPEPTSDTTSSISSSPLICAPTCPNPLPALTCDEFFDPA
jgi:hypothetical protein